jgi:P2 family phage contractile tail tube protein
VYYKLEIDGRVMYEIDMIAGVQVIDGKDQLAEVRSALGL